VKEACCLQDVADYEALRSQAVHADLASGPEQLPCGLAGWLRGPPSDIHGLRLQLPTTTFPIAVSSRGPLPAAVASIVLRLTQEAAYG
jgi:hypothetical protein